MNYILYNSLSNNQIEPEYIQQARKEQSEQHIIQDVVGLDYVAFFDHLKEEDSVTLVGGDGTIHYLVNALGDYPLKNKIYLVPAGSGNDFFRDVATNANQKQVLLNPYLSHLPVVEVAGMKKRFINGIGFGIDGYCCEVGDEFKKTSNQPVNYTSIAIKGLLFHFKPVKAKITVDGVSESFEHVWLAPTMKGRYYGGGMMIAPSQERTNLETVTTVVYKSKSKLKALMAFPSIFKGEHIHKEKMVKIFRGKEIQVEFDRPTALQIDGETVKNVTSYIVRI